METRQLCRSLTATIILLIGVACAQRIVRPLSPSFADLRGAKTVEITDASGTAMLRGTFATKEDTPSDLEREAALVSPTGGSAKGVAEIEIERSGSVVKEDEIELDAEGLPPAASFRLLVDGQEAVVFTTTDEGKVKLKLSRQVGAPVK